MDKGIFWLASYPKSGNTWFRIFLANLLNPTHNPIDLNQLHTGRIASCREWMENALGFDTGLLTHDELDQLRPAVYQEYSKNINDVGYHKIHDAYTYFEDQSPLIPVAGCLGALYFIRNPLDVAISFANHMACSIDVAIEHMSNSQFAFCKAKFRQHTQLRQWLLSWSMHVNSWMNAKNLNRVVIRYEDMKLNTHETFIKAVNFLQLDVTSTKIVQAINDSCIDKLKQWETAFCFSEKPAKVKRFFRKGLVGDWQTTLTDAHVQRIIHDHGDTMRAFGYLDAHGNPIIEYG